MHSCWLTEVLFPRLPCFCFKVPVRLCAWASWQCLDESDRNSVSEQAVGKGRAALWAGRKAYSSTGLTWSEAWKWGGVGQYFSSFNYKNLGQSWFCVYFETIYMEQCVDAFRCQDEQDQKYCFFTVQKDAVVSLPLLKINISTSYPTSDSAIAKSSMTSYPWKQFMKANLHSPLILPELLGKIRDSFTVI